MTTIIYGQSIAVNAGHVVMLVAVPPHWNAILWKRSWMRTLACDQSLMHRQHRII